MTTAAPPNHPAGAAPGPASASAPTGGDPHLAVPQRVAGAEACPLCGTPLSPDQDWCLRCGAAARTRLAATPNWRAPIATIAIVAVLALGVLAAALVKLAGGSSSSSAAATTTVTAPAASTAAAPLPTAPTATTTPGATTPPTATTPGASTSTPSTPTNTLPTATATSPAGAAGSPSTGALGKPRVRLTPTQRQALRKSKQGASGK